MRRLLIFMLLCVAAHAQQPWSGVLSTSRAINWQTAGLPATLPDGETTPNPWTPPTRTQCGSTLNPSGLTDGTDVTNIVNAMAACGSGHYVLLGAGTFYIEAANNCSGGAFTCISMFHQNGVTLRGSGPQSTILKLTGNGQISFGSAYGNGGCSWTSGFSAGSTSLTMNSCTGPTLVAGDIIFLNQCDTGYSGSGCATGSSADNGGLYICGDNPACQTNSDALSSVHQTQAVFVTSVSGSGSGPFTVNFTPGLYMPNWSSGSEPTVAWITNEYTGTKPQPYGNGLEDLTVYATADSPNAAVDLSLEYASWIKGVRFLGAGAYNPLSMGNTKNCLIVNDYIMSDIAIDAQYPAALQLSGSSDDLILNNIMASSVPWEGFGSLEGNVIAYNYGRDTFTAYYEDTYFDHHAGSAFQLFEGDETGAWDDDDTWGTHDLNTVFRGYWSGWDPVYLTINQRGIQLGFYQRFDNVIGNAIGPGPTNGPFTVYQAASYPTAAYAIDTADPLTNASLLRWGNCDTVTNTCRFQSSEIPNTTNMPSGTYPNATAWQNSTPGNNNLPCSFFLTGSSITCAPKYSGGTGLSWWKVCKTWTTFPTSCATTQTQPFPFVGPDLTGGTYVNGTAYDNPAAIAFKNLPIDLTYQVSYAITGSSWSGGTETLTVTGLPDVTHLMGPMQISGGACSTGSGEAYITSSNSTTVSYALGSNPGSCASANMLFPDVRQFDERVYETDGSGPPPPSGLNAFWFAIP